MPSVDPIKRAPLSIFEVSLFRFPQLLVDRAWNKACQLWSIFGFTKPRVNRSLTDEQGTHAGQIAWLNFAEKKVTVNLHRLDIRGIIDHLASIFTHELGHKFCPGDLKTMLLIDHAVRTVIEAEESAHLVGNMFNDMIVNVDAHRRGDRGIPRIYSALWRDKPEYDPADHRPGLRKAVPAAGYFDRLSSHDH